MTMVPPASCPIQKAGAAQVSQVSFFILYFILFSSHACPGPRGLCKSHRRHPIGGALPFPRLTTHNGYDRHMGKHMRWVFRIILYPLIIQAYRANSPVCPLDRKNNNQL